MSRDSTTPSPPPTPPDPQALNPGEGTAPLNRQSARQQWRRQVQSLLAWVLVAVALRWGVIEPRWIPSGSMLPTLQLQDRVLVEKVRPRLGLPLPVGTVVVFRPPATLLAAGYDPNAALIKRVVGTAGDRIEIRDGELWRNDQRVHPDWTSQPIDYDLEPFEVPEGQLLVLGDNRNASLDSHLWGPLPLDRVIGTAVVRYWPLERLGLLPRRPPESAALG